MASKGYLEGSQMAGTFDLLRANDLIFSYVVSGWLMGQDPPAFDLLAWNADSTRMPAAMHSFYLRSLYMRNELAAGEMEVAGQRLALSRVKSDAYVVGAVNDHIVPWTASYQSTALLGGDVRYVLSSGGHIAGIVNPPGPKAWYEAAEHYPPDADGWRAGGPGSRARGGRTGPPGPTPRAGAQVKPPPMGSDLYPAAPPRPGEYVRG